MVSNASEKSEVTLKSENPHLHLLGIQSNIVWENLEANRLHVGKIETPILMEITGHSRESTVLNYIGENPNKDAVADVFMERLMRVGNESG